MKVWCLILDFQSTPISNIFEVFLEKGSSIDDLKTKVKEVQTLDLDNVAPAPLTVWRCTDRDASFQDNDDEALRAQVVNLFDKGNVVQLYEKRIIAELDVSNEEVLFVKLPPQRDPRSNTKKRGHELQVIDNKRSRLNENEDSELVKLWKSVWGAPSLDHIIKRVQVERDSSDIDQDIDHLPSHMWVLQVEQAKNLASSFRQNIMVRQEYIEALRPIFEMGGLSSEHLPTDINAAPKFMNPFLDWNGPSKLPLAGFVFTGQPGIGKTQWLLFLLILRLQARLPTLLQVQTGRVLFFNDDAATVEPTTDYEYVAKMLKPYGPTWILVDSNPDFKGVPQMWINREKLLIVQAPSPRKEHMEWMTKPSRNVERFIMKPWTLAELISGSQFQRSNCSHQELAIFYDGHLASARDVYRYAGSSDDYMWNVEDAISQLGSIQDIQDLYTDALLLQFHRSKSHYIFTLHPGETRDRPQVSLASRFVVKHLIKKIPRHSGDQRLFSIFLEPPNATESSAGRLLDYNTIGRNDDYYELELLVPPDTGFILRQTKTLGTLKIADFVEKTLEPEDVYYVLGLGS